MQGLNGINKLATPQPVGGIKLIMNYNKTYWFSGISVEDAGRVEDPTLCVRPCKSPVGDRSLVLAESNAKCLDEELLNYQYFLS